MPTEKDIYCFSFSIYWKLSVHFPIFIFLQNLRKESISEVIQDNGPFLISIKTWTFWEGKEERLRKEKRKKGYLFTAFIITEQETSKEIVSKYIKY